MGFMRIFKGYWMPPSPTFPGRIIRLRELTSLIGLSRSTVYDFLSPRSPRYSPDFPKPLRLGVSPRSAIGWRLCEVQQWIATRQTTQ
ncbi:helix-turn-helix transcriptional regulator [Polaromonas sp.]|jgi:prophage regulatory protein|uniref:helix-turn-helix transcriptional regulator n=1 Tax=Polaromonas sp. TaxID=1869339 RepID=UPI00352A8A09